jgi:transposase
MLKVEDYEMIKKAILRDGMSQREAAKTFKHGRETIRKILEHGTPPGYQRRQKPVQPIIEPAKHIIDSWIEDEIERKVHRKQRSNATVIWKLLCADHDFRGSVYPVRRYLQKKKRGGGKEVFFPLQFAAGEEGQVDWGQASVMIGNRLVTVHLFCRGRRLFCMRLCYCRAAFVRAYVSEKLECFLDGHVRAFRYFGGVAQSCARSPGGTYDNLRTAVTWVGVGKERKLNARFVEMRCHYVFNSRFCNVASGNEKGLAENLVKRTQSDFLAGVPCFASIGELNAYLEKCCILSAATRGKIYRAQRRTRQRQEASYLWRRRKHYWK